MPGPEDKSNHLCDLLLLVLDGSARKENYVQLNEMLRQSEANRRIYMECMTTYVGLHYFEGNFTERDRNSRDFDMDLWQEMSEHEKNAPATELPKVEPRQEPSRKVMLPPCEKRRLSTVSQVLLVMNAAAILFILLFLRLAPEKSGFEVATLTDSVNALWAGAGIENGARIATGREKLLLREGCAELLFDNQATVTIEGPAEFQILADDRISLSYGKLYSAVSEEATGFSIYTQNSKIVDLGTEFGVEVDLRGQTQLYVTKGKVKLIAGQQSEKTNIEVSEGEAREVSAQTSAVSAISFKPDLFVRKIDSQSNFLWRGQTKCSLADIVGGGDGFGNGRMNFGIDHEGQTKLLDNILAYTQPVPFTSVSSNPFVNGIFVPYGPTQVDSSSNVVYDFGATTGKFYLGVLNGAWHKQRDNAVPRHALRLGGIEYGTQERPAIYIHANQGITFDLQAIRDYTKMEIDSFTSVCGVSETYGDYAEAIRRIRQSDFIKLPKASFYVLVDGREKLIQKDVTHADRPAVISVDIHPEDRFLTLATTEGGDKNDGDWTLFGVPVLMLRSD